jgi:hypothetical protein
VSSIPVKGVKSESNTTQALLRDATKKRIAYLLSKRTIQDLDVYRLVKDFFKEYLHENYEFTFNELAEELKKTYIEKDIKESLYRLLEDFSTIEYKDEEISEEVLRNTLVIFSKLVDQLLSKTSDNRSFLTKIFTKENIPSEQQIVQPQAQKTTTPATRFSEDVSASAKQQPPTDFGDEALIASKTTPQVTKKIATSKALSLSNAFPEDSIPEEQKAKEKQVASTIPQKQSSFADEPLTIQQSAPKTGNTQIKEQDILLHKETKEMPKQAPKNFAMNDDIPLPPPQAQTKTLDIESLQIPEPHKTQSSSQSTEFQLPNLQKKEQTSNFATDYLQKKPQEEKIIIEPTFAPAKEKQEIKKPETSNLGKQSDWSREELTNEKPPVTKDPEIIFHQEIKKDAPSPFAQESLSVEELVKPLPKTFEIEEELFFPQTPVEEIITPTTVEQAPPKEITPEPKQDSIVSPQATSVPLTTPQTTKTPLNPTFSSIPEKISPALDQVPMSPAQKEEFYFGTEEQELSADLNKLAEQLDAIIRDDDLKTKKEAVIIADDIPTLIMETERLIVEKNHQEAQVVYKELVGRYHELPEEEKHAYYDKIQHLYDLLSRNA